MSRNKGWLGLWRSSDEGIREVMGEVRHGGRRRLYLDDGVLCVCGIMELSIDDPVFRVWSTGNR